MKECTQGICEDGAAILEDGQPLTIDKILQRLKESENNKHDRKILLQQIRLASVVHPFKIYIDGVFAVIDARLDLVEIMTKKERKNHE